MTLLRLSHVFRTAWSDGDVVAGGRSSGGARPRLSFGSRNRSKILEREIERERGSGVIILIIIKAEKKMMYEISLFPFFFFSLFSFSNF